MEKPYVPFYKPYGMTDEEYEYEVRIAEQRLAEWEAEQQALRHPPVSGSLPSLDDTTKVAVKISEEAITPPLPI